MWEWLGKDSHFSGYVSYLMIICKNENTIHWTDVPYVRLEENIAETGYTNWRDHKPIIIRAYDNAPTNNST